MSRSRDRRDAVLVVAGSDPLGYSGLQADLRHLARLRVRAIGIPSCLTEQGKDEVVCVRPIEAEHVASVLSIAQRSGTVAAVKVGLVHRPEIVAVLAARLPELGVPIVLDPVLAASAGPSLVLPGTVSALVEGLLPKTTVLTPNFPELRVLAREAGVESGEALAEAHALLARGVTAVYLKGGHAESPGDEIEDLLVTRSAVVALRERRLRGVSPRGTGCALSTRLAAGLAQGDSIENAARGARAAVHAAIERATASGSRYLEF